MKKIKFFAIAASLLALGFGFMGCDEGIASDEAEAATLTGADALKAYNPEIPSTDADLKGDASSTTVSAKWTKFTGTSITAGTELKPTSGTGAKLVSNGTDTTVADITKPEKATGVIKSGADSLTLATYAKTVKGKLALTLDADTNLVIQATGGSSSDGSKRFLVVEYDGKAVVSKGGMLSSTKNTFQIKNAPAGEYTIYFNGVTIISINADGTATEADGGTKDIELKSAVSELAFKGTKNADDEIEIALNSETELVVYADGNEDNDVTASATITVIQSENTPKAVSFDSATSKITALSLGDKATILARVGSVVTKQVFKVKEGSDAISPNENIEFVAGATAEKPISQAFAITLGKEFINADGIAALTKGADVKEYVEAGKSVTITKATVTTAATRKGFTVTVEGTTDETATTGAETMTFTIPKEILSTNLAGAHPDKDVELAAEYTTSSDLTLKLFNTIPKTGALTSAETFYATDYVKASGTASELIEINDVKLSYAEDENMYTPEIDWAASNSKYTDADSTGPYVQVTAVKADGVSYSYEKSANILQLSFVIKAKKDVNITKITAKTFGGGSVGASGKLGGNIQVAGVTTAAASTPVSGKKYGNTTLDLSSAKKEIKKDGTTAVRVSVVKTDAISSETGDRLTAGIGEIVVTAEAAE